MKAKVAIVACPGYDRDEVDAAVRNAVASAGGLRCAGKRVLLKPNVLSASAPGRAVTTHPEVFRAFARLCHESGASKVVAGDSPGWQAQDFAARNAGLAQVAREEGVEWLDFSDEAEIAFGEGSLVKRFVVARAVAEAEFIVTMPKLKTHSLMYYTGAVKNLFGVVPGFKKSAYHVRFPDRRDFGAMILDLCLALKPSFALMDAVVAMEGPGPGNGRPRHVGLVLASEDPISLDVAASAIIGYDPRVVAYLADAERRGLIDISGGAEGAAEYPELTIEKTRVRGFELIKVARDTDFFMPKFPRFLYEAIRRAVVPKPRFSRKRCVACSGCVRICPAGALELVQRGIVRRVEIDLDRCVACYCCHEICPEDAIDLRRRMFHRRRRRSTET